MLRETLEALERDANVRKKWEGEGEGGKRREEGRRWGRSNNCRDKACQATGTHIQFYTKNAHPHDKISVACMHITELGF